MEKKTSISRRSFLKGSAAGMIGIAAAGLMRTGLAEQPSGKYQPGTYSATAQGMSEVKVTMTFDADRITDVAIDVSGETRGIGAELGEQMAAQILENQSAQIDTVSGATVTSQAIAQAADACIAQAEGRTVATGIVEEEQKSWRTAPSPVDEVQIIGTKEADIVVIGFGQAGLACSRAAIENGASVIAIEQMSEDSHAWTGADFGHINSQWEKERGIPEVDPVEMLNDWQLRGCNMSNPNLVMQFLKHSGETFDWFVNMASEEEKAQIRAFHHPYPTEFKGMQAGQKFWDGTAQFAGVFFQSEFNYQVNCKRIRDYCVEKGLQLFYENDAQYLEKDASGRVTGVIARTPDGYVRYNGKKGVVLAAGDFSRDADMVAELCPTVNALNFSGDGRKITGFDRDGKGIKMGVWAGGKLEPGPLSTMGGTFCFPSGIMGAAGVLWLDSSMERFCNEAFGDPVLTGAEVSRHKGTVTSLFDADIMEELQHFPSGHGSAFVNNPEYQESLRQMLDDAVAAGPEGVERCLTITGGMAHLFAANTLEELAAYLGLDADQTARMLASVEQYNAKCDAKYDDDYGKDPDVLFPVRKAPFYGYTKPIEAGYEFLCTTGGLWTDNYQNVYDETLETIPGLYATGNCCGRRFGVQYTTPIAGVSVGMAQTLGRLLGEHLAKL